MARKSRLSNSKDKKVEKITFNCPDSLAAKLKALVDTGACGSKTDALLTIIRFYFTSHGDKSVEEIPVEGDSENPEDPTVVPPATSQ